jgi:hypothetical protein
MSSLICKDDQPDPEKDDCGMLSRMKAMTAFIIISILLSMASAGVHVLSALLPVLPAVVGPALLGVTNVCLLIGWALAAGTLNYDCKESGGKMADQNWKPGPMFALLVTSWILSIVALAVSVFGNMRPAPVDHKAAAPHLQGSMPTAAAAQQGSYQPMGHEKKANGWSMSGQQGAHLL